MIFGIDNEYQDVYIDLDELKSDFSGSYVKKRLTICELELGNRPEIGVYLEKQLVMLGTMKNYYFWWVDSSMC